MMALRRGRGAPVSMVGGVAAGRRATVRRSRTIDTACSFAARHGHRPLKAACRAFAGGESELARSLAGRWAVAEMRYRIAVRTESGERLVLQGLAVDCTATTSSASAHAGQY